MKFSKAVLMVNGRNSVDKDAGFPITEFEVRSEGASIQLISPGLTDPILVESPDISFLDEMCFITGFSLAKGRYMKVEFHGQVDVRKVSGNDNVAFRAGFYDLKLTNAVAPEQYDVFFNGYVVGYLRLRHGHFTAQYSDPSGPIVYESKPAGSEMFQNDEERSDNLQKAVQEIHAHRINLQKESSSARMKEILKYSQGDPIKH